MASSCTQGGGQVVSNKMKAGGGGSTGVSLFRLKIFLLLNALMFEGLIKVLLTGLKPGDFSKHTKLWNDVQTFW